MGVTILPATCTLSCVFAFFGLMSCYSVLAHQTKKWAFQILLLLLSRFIHKLIDWILLQNKCESSFIDTKETTCIFFGCYKPISLFNIVGIQNKDNFIVAVLFIRTWLFCLDFKYSDMVCFVEFLVSNISRKMAWSECEACFWSQKRATTLQCNRQGLSLLYLLPHLWWSILVAFRELKEIPPDSVLQLYIAMSHSVLFWLSMMKTRFMDIFCRAGLFMPMCIDSKECRWKCFKEL